MSSAVLDLLDHGEPTSQRSQHTRHGGDGKKGKKEKEKDEANRKTRILTPTYTPTSSAHNDDVNGRRRKGG
jgi:hypothetical protein